MVQFFRMSRFASQNGSFYSSEWLILRDKKARFEV